MKSGVVVFSRHRVRQLTPHPKPDSTNSNLFTTVYQHPWTATTAMVVMSMSMPLGPNVAAEAWEMMTSYGSTCAAVEAFESYMRRKKQPCTGAALKAAELLGDEEAYVHNVAHSSDGYISGSSSSAHHHFISMLPVQTVEAQQDKLIEEETTTAV